MRVELKRCNYIGDLPSMYSIALLAMTGQETDTKSISSMIALNSRINAKANACLALYAELGLILEDGLKIKSTDLGKDIIRLSEKEFENRISELTLSYLIENQLIANEAIVYDTNQHICRIKKSGFPLSTAVFRNLLIEIGALKETEPGIYDLHPDLETLFETEIKRNKPTLSLEQLMEIHKRQERQGRLAEEFVVAFEMKRLLWSNNADMVKQISDFDTGAGYDIVSFNTPESAQHDRFIEVKSYASGESFFWSSNEMKTAKEYKDRYYLYLVDMEQFQQIGYEPTIVQNPAAVIFQSDDWILETESVKVTKV